MHALNVCMCLCACVIDMCAMCALYTCVHTCMHVFCMCVVHVYVCTCLCVVGVYPCVYVCLHVFACVPRGILTHLCTCEGQRSTSDVLPIALPYLF